MGLNLRVETENETLHRICTALFGGFGPGDPQRAADLNFNLVVSQPECVTACPVFQFPVFQFEDDWACAWAGSEQAIRANLATGAVHGCFPQELLRDEAVLRHHYLQFALAVLLTARGFAGIHAAGLERNGRTVLVRGARGSGKSVLACAAVERGWRVLADSTVWIAPNGDWWGIPWWLRLRHSAASLFPKLAFDSAAFVAEEDDGEAKLEISVDQIRPGSGVTHAPAGVVLFLEQNLQGDSCLDTLAAEESFALWPAGGSGREALAPAYRERIEKVLGKGAYRLCLGHNLDLAIDLLDRLLEGRAQLSG
jgi:hypothetical protein